MTYEELTGQLSFTDKTQAFVIVSTENDGWHLKSRHRSFDLAVSAAEADAKIFAGASKLGRMIFVAISAEDEYFEKAAASC